MEIIGQVFTIVFLSRNIHMHENGSFLDLFEGLVANEMFPFFVVGTYIVDSQKDTLVIFFLVNSFQVPLGEVIYYHPDHMYAMHRLSVQ